MIDRTEVFGELEGEAFERIAPGYFPLAIVREHEARYRWAGRFVSGKKALDVGCGTAYGCAILSQSGAREVTGVDNCLAALHYGKKFGNTHLVLGNILHLPFPSSAFDILTCFEVIEHVVDQQALLEEMVHVLKVGGMLILSTPNWNRTSGKNPYHVRELTLQELTALIAKCGLDCTERSGQHWRMRPAILQRIFGIRRLIYGIENSAKIFTLLEIIAEPSVYLLVARKEQ
jgi:2-polyprenyl-3-methyl-5-hydroxy-6-metoxy-1,4-benzoquinol methylase